MLSTRPLRSGSRAALAATLALGALLFTPAAQADAVGVSLGGGTAGVGLHLSVPLASSVNARLGLNYMRYNLDIDSDDIEYRMKLKFQSFDALVDWFPFEGSFRVTGGLMYNNNKFTGYGRPNSNGTYTINGNTYSAATVGQIDGQIDFRRMAPYLGVGWDTGRAAAKGWGFTADVGMMFQGRPRSSLSHSNCTAAAPVCQQLARDIDAENASFGDDASSYRIFPILRAGAIYRF